MNIISRKQLHLTAEAEHSHCGRIYATNKALTEVAQRLCGRSCILNELAGRERHPTPGAVSRIRTGQFPPRPVCEVVR